MKLFIFIILTPSFLYSQGINSTYGRSLNNIYNDALARFVSVVKAQDKNYKDYLDTVFIEENYFINDDDFVWKVKGIPVELTKYAALQERPGRVDSAVLLSIRPMHFSKGRFYVFIAADCGYHVETPNFKWKYGITFYYSYSEKSKTFIYRSLEYPKVISLPPIE